MHIRDFQPGVRVRVIEDTDLVGSGTLPAGAEGTVTAIERYPLVDMPFAWIEMDQKFLFLGAWENKVQVFRHLDGCCDVTEQSFAVIIGFG